MDKSKKEEFMKSWHLFKSIGPTILSKIEEGQNGYYIELVSFQDFMTVLNFLGQMAAQFNVDYCYEEGNEYKIETYDYQITVIDFDINWKNRSTQYI